MSAIPGCFVSKYYYKVNFVRAIALFVHVQPSYWPPQQAGVAHARGGRATPHQSPGEREREMPASPSTSEASAADKRGATEATGEASSGEVQGEQPLEKDELVQQVMRELKQGGGVATLAENSSVGEDLLDIEIESGATIRPALQQAKQAGEKLGQQLRRQQEDRRRTLRVGGLTVKLPPAKKGEAARGTLTAKVKRVSKALGEEKSESLTARTKRVAAFMDLGDESQPQLGGAKVRKVREHKKERPPLRRRRHLSAC